ncbi:hypothetical protein D3093_15365 (plasmid) [Azospirillum argentinense]|uniref:Uncharacterized protein n=1 Tax=Azospirillum argentinense TaxID=2970906 RepID=A0A4D8PPC0_9PROT|nr:hypothetical protein D3093_15365 [Azospirillum argentinense]
MGLRFGREFANTLKHRRPKLGGNGTSVMLLGTTGIRDPCHPAWSGMSTAWTSGSRLREKPSRNRLMAVVETVGVTSAKSTPLAGQTAA